jgi:hypothetical protein
MTRRGMASLVGGVVLGAVLTAIGFAVARGPGGGLGSATSQLDRLAAQLDSLESEMRAVAEWKHEVLRGERSWADGPPTPVPQPLSEAPDPLVKQLDSLRTELKALADRIDAQAAESRTALADLRAGLEAAASGPEPMPASLPETPLNLPAFAQISDRPEDDVTNEHLLWTYDRVAETYGHPTRIQPNPADRGGGIKFIYELPGGSPCVFWFKGGKVVRVYP